MFRILSFFLFLSSLLFSEEEENYVLCIHGFMGASWNMSFLETSLKNDGWHVINWDYPSREYLIEEHGKHLAEDLMFFAEKKPGTPIHFVTHSMGGLVLLAALNHPLCPEEAKKGKVILITPPLHGSSWARWLHQFSIARLLAKGASGNELMTKTDFELGEYPDSLQDLLILSGSLGFNPLLKGENDGTLSAEETHLSSPHEHIVLKKGHLSILFSKETSEIVRKFFKSSTSHKDIFRD